MLVRVHVLALALLLPAAAHGQGAAFSPLWGSLANPGFENHRIRTTLFFSGQASDGTNPYGIADPPGSRLFLYTAHPTDNRHLRWSESAANRDFAMSQMVNAGINVVTMSSWGESFLDSLPRPPWAVFAPMQTSPASHDELFTAAVGQPLLVTPFIESRGDWSLRQEFPNPQGSVAPGAMSQIVDLVNRYLKNNDRPQWADQWTRVYDRDGQERYAMALIHASSNQLAEHQHGAYAQGFDTLADEVYAQTGVKVGFFLDVLARDSFAPGTFKPTPEETGPELFNKASILGLQNFLPEIWAGVPNETARMNWKRDFSSRWAATGIPFLMDVAPGYDAQVVFPGSVQYGHNPAWIDGMTALIEDFGQHGLVYNSWNGYTEAMLAVESIEHGDAYFQWLRTLTAIHEPARWAGNIGNWAHGLNWNPHSPNAELRTILDNGGTIHLVTVASARLVDVGTVSGRGGSVRVSTGAALTIHDGGFRLGLVDGGQGNLVMTGGSVDVIGGFNMFLVGDHGNGTATISGGSITARTFGIALQPTSTGNVELSGDAVITTTGDRFVMGMIRNLDTGERPTASLTMTGGAINVSQGDSGVPDFVAAFDGTANLDMSGGTINVGGNFVSAVAGTSGQVPRSQATINHSGGTINTGAMTLGERGIADYTLSATGQINARGLMRLGWFANSESTFTQTGGAVHLALNNPASDFVGLKVGQGGHGTYAMSGGELHVPGRLWIAELAGSVGRMSIDGGVVHIGENLAVGMQGDAELTQAGGELNVGGSLHVANGAFANSLGAHNHAGGTLSVSGNLNVGRDNGSGVSSISGGSVTVDGLMRIWSTGTVDYRGGSINAAALQVDAGGRLKVELGPPAPESELAPLAFTAAAALGGTLDVSFVDTFAPTAGDSFEILTAVGGISGIFANHLLPSLTGGLHWNVDYSANSLVLAVAGLPGDFNGDGVVDAADYAVWRDGLGTTFTEAQYHVWKSNFGETADGTTGSLGAPVPEPPALLMLATGLLLWVSRHKGAHTIRALPPSRSVQPRGERHAPRSAKRTDGFTATCLAAGPRFLGDR